MWGRQTRMGRGQPSYAAGYLFNVGPADADGVGQPSSAAGYLFNVGPADADGVGTTQQRRRVFI